MEREAINSNFRNKTPQVCLGFEDEQIFKSKDLRNGTLPSSLQPSGHYMYHQFHIQQYYVLPTQCIYVFCVDLRTNSDYFPIQH